MGKVRHVSGPQRGKIEFSSGHQWGGITVRAREVIPDPPRPAADPHGFHARAVCPDCSGPMAIRVNGRDRSTFLGCKAYPRCKGTIAFPRLPKAAASHFPPRAP